MFSNSFYSIYNCNISHELLFATELASSTIKTRMNRAYELDEVKIG